MPTPKTIPYPDDLAYLQDELHWIEARCRRIGAQLRLNELEGGTERRRGPNAAAAEHDPDVITTRLKTARTLESRLRKSIDARLAIGADTPTSLDRLCAMHGLDAFERTLVLLAAAPTFSREFEQRYGVLGGGGYRADSLTVDVAFTFAELSFAERITRRATFAKAAPLFTNDVLVYEQLGRCASPEELLGADLRLASRTFAFLVGNHALSGELVEFSALEEPLVSLDQVVLDAADKQRILSVVERHEEYLACRQAWGFDDVIRYGRGVFMLFYGPPGTGKTMTAHGVAKHLGRRVLNVDIPNFLDHRERDQFLPALFREARLQEAVLFFDECEALFGDRAGGNLLMNVLLTEIERFEGVAILATNLPHLLDPALERRILVKVPFREPDRDARLEIWRKHLPSKAPLAADVDTEVLASQFELAGGYIKNAVLTAVAAAVHDGGQSPQITMAHLEAAARAQVRRVDETTQNLVYSKVRLADVAVSPSIRERLGEIVDAARNRRVVLERWGIGSHLSYGKGTSALLYGPSGTGKTLCAEAIAGELNRPLLVASIPGLLSMWVGATEKNIDRLFAEARAHGAVLFLDEADALLGARGTGRGSRHDDTVVDVLLVAIERFDGVVILATNLADRLDPALGRRLGWQLELPLPDAALREAIWRRLLPDTVPTADDLDLALLARRHKLSGGQIKNAVLRAAFRAARTGQPVDQEILEHAAAEESGAGAQPRMVGFAGHAK